MIWLERVGIIAAVLVGMACLRYGLRRMPQAPAAAISWDPDSLIARPTLYEATKVRAGDLELGDTFIVPSTGITYHVDCVEYHRRIARWRTWFRQLPFRPQRNEVLIGDRAIVV